MPHQHQQHLKMEKSRAKFYFSFPSGFKFASVWTAFTAKRYVWGRSFGSKNFLIIVSNAGARLLALLHQWTLRFSSLSVFFIPRFVERKTNESFVSAAVRVFLLPSYMANRKWIEFIQLKRHRYLSCEGDGKTFHCLNKKAKCSERFAHMKPEN